MPPNLIPGPTTSSGSSGYTRTAVTTDTVLSGTGALFADVTTLAANLVVTLPAATTAGQAVVVADSTRTAGSAHLVAIAAAGSDTIEGCTRIILDSDGGAVLLVSDGASKWVVASCSGVWGIDPRTISSLAAWWAPERGVTLNGRTVSAWADQSGNGNDLAQATSAQRPALVSGFLNGRAGLIFDGGQIRLIRSGVSSAVTGNAVFAALAPANWAVAPGPVIFALNFVNTSNQGLAVSQVGTAGIFVNPDIGLFANGYAGASAVAANGTAALVLPNNSTHVVSLAADATTAYARIDGQDWTSNSALAAPTVETGTLVLGCDSVASGGTFYTGAIGAFIWLKAVPTTAERTQLESYLRRKYGGA